MKRNRNEEGEEQLMLGQANKVTIIGAGLAGSEAAWQVANQGVDVVLYEMRPTKRTPAHHTSQFAELVCSNSLRSNALTNAVGVLKEEMRRMNSIILSSADKHAVPAGGALAVDRERFSGSITETLSNHPRIEVRNEELTVIPDGIVIVATGPLTSPALSTYLQELTGEEYLYFYDAASPIIEKDSINMDKVYLASRYDKGDAAYLNCPFNEEQFDRFYEELIHAETAPLKDFEKEMYFESCMPIEVMAKRGKETIVYGPMKPVGLPDPRTGKIPRAVVQLRQDNSSGTLYNIVGISNQFEMGRTKASVFFNPWTGKCGNCPLWSYASKHFYQFAPFASSYLSIETERYNLFCRTNDRCRRVCGICRFWINRRYQCCSFSKRERTSRVSTRDSIRKFSEIYYYCEF